MQGRSSCLRIEDKYLSHEFIRKGRNQDSKTISDILLEIESGIRDVYED